MNPTQPICEEREAHDHPSLRHALADGEKRLTVLKAVTGGCGKSETEAWLIRMIETCEDSAMRKAFAEKLASRSSSTKEMERLREENAKFQAMFDHGWDEEVPLLRSEIDRLKRQVEVLRAFAGSFHVTVTDSYYKDVYLHLESPHALSMRIANDSSKSFIFADLEKRRLEALAAASDIEKE